jgi:ParB-like chromosome segregation protein Spo0J
MPYTIIEVDIEALHNSPYQPASRMQMNSALIGLQNSIAKDKLLYPPLVTRNIEGDGYTIVDGHRRVKCIRNLGWPKVSVLLAQNWILHQPHKL